MYSCTWKHFFFFSLPYRHLFLDLLLRIQLVTPWLMIKQRGWQKTQKLLQNYLSIYGQDLCLIQAQSWCEKDNSRRSAGGNKKCLFLPQHWWGDKQNVQKDIGCEKMGLPWDNLVSILMDSCAVIFALRSLQRPQMVSRHERWVWA